jgi:hypothetical protein
MIPYVIEQARPDDDCRAKNIIIKYGYCEKDDLDKEIIDHIIEIMYEICSEEYGEGIEITSYDHFCQAYWLHYDLCLSGYGKNMFSICYFENDKWNEINLDNSEYKEKIYNSYVKKYISILK